MMDRGEIFVELMERYADGQYRYPLGRTALLIVEAAKLSGCSEQAVHSRSKVKAVANARLAAMAASYAMSDTVSLPTLGIVFNRDHTSVLHGIREVAKEVGLPEDPKTFRPAARAKWADPVGQPDEPFKQNFRTPSDAKMDWLRSMLFVEASTRGKAA